MKTRTVILAVLMAALMAACGNGTNPDIKEDHVIEDASVPSDSKITDDSVAAYIPDSASVIRAENMVPEHRQVPPAERPSGLIYHDTDLVYPDTYDIQMGGFSSAVIRENKIDTEALRKAVGDLAYEAQMDVSICEFIKKMDGNYDPSAAHAFIVRLNGDRNKDMTVIDTGNGYLLVYDRTAFTSEETPSGEQQGTESTTSENTTTETVVDERPFTLYDAPSYIGDVVPDQDAMLGEIQSYLESIGQGSATEAYVVDDILTDTALHMTCTAGPVRFTVETELGSGTYNFAQIQ